MLDEIRTTTITLSYLDGLFDGCTGMPQNTVYTNDLDYQTGYQQGWLYWLHVPSIHPIAQKGTTHEKR